MHTKRVHELVRCTCRAVVNSSVSCSSSHTRSWIIQHMYTQQSHANSDRELHFLHAECHALAIIRPRRGRKSDRLPNSEVDLGGSGGPWPSAAATTAASAAPMGAAPSAPVHRPKVARVPMAPQTCSSSHCKRSWQMINTTSTSTHPRAAQRRIARRDTRRERPQPRRRRLAEDLTQRW